VEVEVEVEVEGGGGVLVDWKQRVWDFLKVHCCSC